MDIIKWHIIDSTFICCETLMLLLLANSFLPRRAKWWGWVFAIVAPIALQQLSDVLSLDAPYGAFPHFILDVIIVFLLYKERFLKKIGVTLLYYLIMAVCEGLVMAILSFTIGYDLANVTEHDTHQVICMVLAHLVILFGVAVVSLAVRRIRAHNRFSIPIRYWIPLVLLPLFEFVIIMLWIPYNRGTAPAEDTVALIVVVLMLVFSTLFTWLLLYRLSEMHFESVVVSRGRKTQSKNCVGTI